MMEEKIEIKDPFVGSGTTLIASKLEGRDCIGIEKDHEYVKIAKERLNKLKTLKELERIE
jgi:DNA modification methylase